MQIDWWTLALQAINFIILVWLLRRFLYGPVKDVIAKRRALSEEAMAKAAAKEEEAEKLKQRLEEERADLAQERRQMLKEVQDQTAEAREKALKKSGEDARQMIDDAKAAIAKERDETLADLKAEVGHLAVDLASEILKKSDAATLGNACFDLLEAHLKGLGASELAQLREDAAADGDTAGASLVTAEPVPDAEQEKWRTMLSRYLGDETAIVFETDPSLIGGAELRFPHTVLKFSWADRLERARRMLQGDDTAT